MEKKTLICKRPDTKGHTQFWNEVNVAFKEGYTFDVESLVRKELPRSQGIIVVTLVRGEKEVSSPAVEEPVKESIKESVEEVLEELESKPVEKLVEPSKDILESLTKKKELLAHARKLGIQVPKEMKQPAAIKKHIKAQSLS